MSACFIALAQIRQIYQDLLLQHSSVLIIRELMSWKVGRENRLHTENNFKATLEKSLFL